MNSPTETLRLSDLVRQETIGILDKLIEKAYQFELPKPPEALQQYRYKLADNTYKVLVLGEAKRGKSTFINALIGRDILPTDLAVATNQVFSVRQAEREAYRLRFEDDSTQEITLNDLPRYGSQVVADAGGSPRLDQILRLIEVDVPVSFLPPRVSILDTPGLGAIFAEHAQITHRFIPLADAVIFVLDSDQPVLQSELDLIEAILDFTKNIFFIQTKIDLYNTEDWQKILQRNQEILSQRFANRLADTRVWPISSKNLRKAAAPDNKMAEAHLTVARYKELAQALQAFLYRVAGWSRTAEAVMVAEHYLNTAQQTLNGRWSALLEESKQKQSAVQQKTLERRQQFDSEWGEHGEKYRMLIKEINDVIAIAKQDIRQALWPEGVLAITQREKIDAIKTLDEAQKRGAAISDEVIASAAEQWQRICREAHGRCVELLGPFLNEAETLALPQETQLSDLVVRDRASIDIESMWWQKVKSARQEAAAASSIVGTIATALIIASVVSTPVAAVGILIAGLWGWRKGWSTPVFREREIAKQKLREHLAIVLQQVRRHFFDVNLSLGRFSRVDEYFEEFEAAFRERMKNLAKQKSDEAQAEYQRLVEGSKLDDQQRKTKAERTRQQVLDWTEIGKSIKGVMAQLKNLDQSFASRANV
jgi:GTPase SAR1 family protein